MKRPSKDPFEVAFEDLEEDYDEEEPPPPPPSQQQMNPQNQQQQQQQQQHQQVEEEDEQEEVSPSESPMRDDEIVAETQMNSSIKIEDEFNTNLQSSTLNNNNNSNTNNKKRKLSISGQASTSAAAANARDGKNKEDDDDEEEENMEVELGKFSSSGDPDKMAKMQAILSQLTEEQMSRYESFRRSGFQKANMKKLLASITGSPKISVPMTIVVSGIAKMFVGELVETGRIIMTERGETGPIRPCHIREAYRRLKLEGKVPKKSFPRLFR